MHFTNVTSLWTKVMPLQSMLGALDIYLNSPPNGILVHGRVAYCSIKLNSSENFKQNNFEIWSVKFYIAVHCSYIYTTCMLFLQAPAAFGLTTFLLHEVSVYFLLICHLKSTCCSPYCMYHFYIIFIHLYTVKQNICIFGNIYKQTKKD